MSGEIRNFVFDVGNVLLSYDPMRTLRTVFHDEDACHAVYNAVFCAPEWPLADEGLVTEEDQLRAALRRAPEYETEIRYAMDHWHLYLPEIEGMPELVKALKESGYGIYVLSNFGQRFYQMKDHDDLFALADGILISSDHKLVKPFRAIYELLLSKFSLRAEECLFIDDLEENIYGARAAGLHGHRFTGHAELCAWLRQEKLLPRAGKQEKQEK